MDSIVFCGTVVCNMVLALSFVLLAVLNRGANLVNKLKNTYGSPPEYSQGVVCDQPKHIDDVSMFFSCGTRHLHASCAVQSAMVFLGLYRTHHFRFARAVCFIAVHGMVAV